MRLFRESAAAWGNRSSSNYVGYQELVKELNRMSFERALAETRVFIGSPETILRQARQIVELFGDIEPSLSVLYAHMPYELAERSLRLFAKEVMPHLAAPLRWEAGIEAASNSFITSPCIPVRAKTFLSCNLGRISVWTDRISPPVGVQARPIASPIKVGIARSLKISGGPRNSRTFCSVIVN